MKLLRVALKVRVTWISGIHGSYLLATTLTWYQLVSILA